MLGASKNKKLKIPYTFQEREFFLSRSIAYALQVDGSGIYKFKMHPLISLFCQNANFMDFGRKPRSWMEMRAFTMIATTTIIEHAILNQPSAVSIRTPIPSSAAS